MFELIPPEEIENLAKDRGVIEQGKLIVRKVQLKGDQLLFPERGITRELLRKVVVDHYIQRGPLLSVSQIHDLAYKLTRTYREQGLAFAEVYVTPQEVVGGKVVLRVLVGRLSEVRVLGGSRYSAGQLMAPFRSQFGAPVYIPAIEKGVDRVNRLPGLEVYGVFSVGRYQGETRLNLRVVEETARRMRFVLDNHGVRETGRHRVQLQYQENNLWGMGETLRITAMGADQSGTVMGSFNYSQPLSYSQRWGIGLSRNEFEVDGRFAALGVSGELDTVSGHWTLKPEGNARSRWRTSLAYKRARVESESFPRLLDQRSDYVSLLLQFHKVFRTPSTNLVQYLDLTPQVGQVVKKENTNLDGVYSTLRGGWSLRYNWRGATRYSSRLRVRGQYSPDPVPSAERTSLTGANAVRGYEPGRFSGDSAFRVSYEQQLYEFTWAGNWRVRPGLFSDFARGWREDAGNGQAYFWGGGVGLSLGYGDVLEAEIDWGVPIDESTLAIDEPRNSSVIHGRMSLSF